jgi:hypothetical protein
VTVPFARVRRVGSRLDCWIARVALCGVLCRRAAIRTGAFREIGKLSKADAEQLIQRWHDVIGKVP